MSGRKSESSPFPPTFWIDIAVIAVSTGLFLMTLGYPRMASTFPRLVLTMIFVVAIIDLIVTLRSKEEANTLSGEERAEVRIAMKRVIHLAALMFIFFFFMIFIGYILGTFLFIILSGIVLGYRKKVQLLISAIIITASVYIIFNIIVKAHLPVGYLFIDLM
ncbi:MAG: tripartite tricarboxylate transporter TctB family protein [Desulfobacteraceae bacterium]|nr:tripartite tricarboxylate transporter TctB family protein [Desulfobacteraceae bacterium]